LYGPVDGLRATDPFPVEVTVSVYCAVTVKVAAVLVIVPAVFVTTQRHSAPLSDESAVIV
jgi:hypothetical protein